MHSVRWGPWHAASPSVAKQRLSMTEALVPFTALQPPGRTHKVV